MVADKIRQLIERLSEKTESGEVVWERTSREGVFQLALTDFSILIVPHPTRLQILNSEGEQIEEVTVMDLTAAGFKDARGELQRVYGLAKRRVMGVDHALDAVLAELG